MLLPIDIFRYVSAYLPITDAVVLQQVSPIILLDGVRRRVSLLDFNVSRTIEFLKTATGYQRVLYAICTDDVRLFKSAWSDAPCHDYVPMCVNAQSINILEFLLSIDVADQENMSLMRYICQRRPIPVSKGFIGSIPSYHLILNYLVDMMLNVKTNVEYQSIEKTYIYLNVNQRRSRILPGKYSVLDHIAIDISMDPFLIFKINRRAVDRWDKMGFLSEANPLRIFLGEVVERRGHFKVSTSHRNIKAYLDGKPVDTDDFSIKDHTLRRLAQCYLNLNPDANVKSVTTSVLLEEGNSYTERIDVTPQQTDELSTNNSFLYVLPGVNPVKYMYHKDFKFCYQHLPKFKYSKTDRITPRVVAADVENIPLYRVELHPVNVAYHLHRRRITATQFSRIYRYCHSSPVGTIIELLAKYERGELPHPCMV